MGNRCGTRAACAALLALSVGFAGAVRAQHKLFITDVLDPGEMEVGVGLAVDKLKAGFHSSSPAVPLAYGTVTRERSQAAATLGLGFAGGWQASVRGGYSFVDDLTSSFQSPAFPSVVTRMDGLQDVSFMLKRRFAGEGPFVVSTQLDVKPRTADRNRQGGTGWTHLSPSVAVSMDRPRGLRLFATAVPTFRTDGGADSLTFNAGLEKAIGGSVSFNLSGGVGRSWPSRTETAHNAFNAAFAVYVQLQRNLYVIPSLSVTYIRPSDSRDGRVHVDAHRSRQAALSVYRLF